LAKVAILSNNKDALVLIFEVVSQLILLLACHFALDVNAAEDKSLHVVRPKHVQRQHYPALHAELHECFAPLVLNKVSNAWEGVPALPQETHEGNQAEHDAHKK
jgi:hypothetical protein